MIRASLLLIVALLPGCTTSVPPPGCGAEERQALVGQPLSVVEAALPDGYKVDYPLPDGTVTLEDFPDRLRVSVDRDGIVRSLGCG